jgi:hypothetical protein
MFVRAVASKITLQGGLTGNLANLQALKVPSGCERIQDGKVDDSVVVEIQRNCSAHNHMCRRVDDLRVRGLCHCKHTDSGGAGGECVGVKSMME